MSRTLYGIQSFFGSEEPLFEKVFEHLPVAAALWDITGTIHYANDAFCLLSGYHQKELVNGNISLMKSIKNDPSAIEHFWRDVHQDKKFSGRLWAQHKNGNNALHQLTVTHIQLGTTYFLSTHVNITEESEAQERYRYLAHHDPLTGLANRTLFEDRLKHAINNATRNSTNVGIIFCDLNEFKQLNDNYGHLIGDTALQEVARRLQACFRSNDTIARFGGDEFVVIIENLRQPNELSRLADNLQNIIREPICDLDFCLSASIGIATFPSDGLTVEQLIEIADNKMYHNKNRFYGLVS